MELAFTMVDPLLESANNINQTSDLTFTALLGRGDDQTFLIFDSFEG
jgi:hypothetical protein